MGTRGSYGFLVKNQLKMKYNHYDSYPTGLGIDVMKKLKKVLNEIDYKDFVQNVINVSLVDENQTATEEHIKKYEKYANLNVSTQKLTNYYVLLRELQNGQDIFNIANGEIDIMLDGNNFVKDSLFCEWAYLINIDLNQLEIYDGFQEVPDETNKFGQENKGGYYPVKLIASINFDNIKTMSDSDIEEYMTKIETSTQEQEDEE